ncbi:DUF2784 domain-containing protein [Novipirellula artificiosorum]|uniref:DUF2784 domain-containing protein n=1 Tax=Novipirellula artificiosorum TaxID=2528016 RepID=A0A5C6DZ38_9BACT|nr:DUF2784 domain-containing protein [Novipirellula artificiosorum]TWU41910.1 hypothetical protein Poly41_02030 [Novipirellula artificiosorum]
MIYQILTELIVAIHFAYVTFVVLAVPVTILGGWRNWEWVRNRWFRCLHVSMILVVVLEAWAGITCPLTTWEQQMRLAAGGPALQGDFIANWLHDAMFFDAQPWVFTLFYSLFASLVIAMWVWIPPRFDTQGASATGR